ncbi:MAG: DUF2283 domain-containing protein [bacterium]|nr:DUF2283 domain-containing protein [bacterium]
MQKRKQKRISRPDSVLSVKHGSTLVTYDKEADAAYFSVKKGKVARTVQLDDWLLADVDKRGALIGVEMLFVSLRAPRQSIVSTLKMGRIPVGV